MTSEESVISTKQIVMPRLVALEGPNRGAVIRLAQGENHLGRDPGNEVCLPDRLISRQHACLDLQGQTARLRDLKSTNATYVNGLRVTGERAIEDGDEIRLGNTVLVFVTEQDDSAGDSPGGLEDTMKLQADGVPASASSGRRMRPSGSKRGLSTCLVGESAAIHKISDLIARCAPLNSTVLIRGESGTGKELVAEALHRLGPRRDLPFVIVNCATLEPQLLESELFGHEQGAFTGAIARRLGKLEMAGTGTIFLDEVGELPASAQAKLLRAIDARRFERVGGSEVLVAKARFLAATHRNLEDMVEEGTFREDLLFRLRVVEIPIPPLRERIEDLLPLVEYFLSELRQTIPSRASRITRAALEELQRHPFRGNVRELRNILERSLIFCEREAIDVEDLFPGLGVASAGANGGGAPAPRAADAGVRSLEDVEREQILRALQQTAGNKTQAAKLLGIDRVTLYAKLKKYGIDG